MKKKKLLMICIPAAALVALLLILVRHSPEFFSSATAFPFEQAAYGIRLLSDAGPLGNGLALALWVGISAIPAIFACSYGRGKETRAERVSLLVLSGTLLLALYGMANPRFFTPALFETVSDYSGIVKPLLGGTVWAVLVLYMVLRLIRLLKKGGKEQLFHYLQLIMCALGVVFGAAGVVALVSGLQALGSRSPEGAEAIISYVLLVAEFVPYLLVFKIILEAVDLLETVGKEEEEGMVQAARRVSNSCCLALGVTSALSAGANILQVVFLRRISNASVQVNIPLGSIAFTLLVLLFARLLVENKELRDDNSMFI